jgi:putative SOS response-associated peptidase YedK
MIITEPNEFVAEAHDRMPVLLKPDQFEHWLSGNMGVKELKPSKTTICNDGRFPSGSIARRLIAMTRR